MNENERLKKYIKDIYNNNTSELARKLDVKPQSVQPYLKNKKIGGIMQAKLKKIGLNPNWLIYGEGDMLLMGDKEEIKESEDKEYKELEERLDNITEELVKTNAKFDLLVSLFIEKKMKKEKEFDYDNIKYEVLNKKLKVK